MLESAATNRRENSNEGALLFGDLTQEGMSFSVFPSLMHLSHTIFWASTDPAQSLVVGLVKGHDVDLQVRSLSHCLPLPPHSCPVSGSTCPSSSVFTLAEICLLDSGCGFWNWTQDVASGTGLRKSLVSHITDLVLVPGACRNTDLIMSSKWMPMSPQPPRDWSQRLFHCVPLADNPTSLSSVFLPAKQVL